VRRLLTLTLALALASCVAAPPAQHNISLNLENTKLLAQLGAAPFDDVVWQRTVDGLTVVGSTAHADPTQLDLLGVALDEIPPQLMDRATPREFVRVTSAPEAETVGKAMSFTIGPDIYLVDRTFDPFGHGTSRFDLARVVAHELVHVAQFMTLEPDYIGAVLDGRLDQVDPANGSQLVRDFAEATGWSDASSDPFHAAWHLDGPAATDYGALGPAEDMAESVAMVVMGMANWIPDNHTHWVEQWLDASAQNLAAGKPWIPAGSTEVVSSQILYDEAALVTAAPGATHRDAIYFELPATIEDHLSLGPDIEDQLTSRGLSGTFTRVDVDQAPHYQGIFTRDDGVRFWVELWDYRDAGPGSPDVPLLAYVELW